MSEVVAVELAETLVFVDLGGAFELPGAEVAAVLRRVGVGACRSAATTRARYLCRSRLRFIVRFVVICFFGATRFDAVKLRVAIAPELQMGRGRLCKVRYGEQLPSFNLVRLTFFVFAESLMSVFLFFAFESISFPIATRPSFSAAAAALSVALFARASLVFALVSSGASETTNSLTYASSSQ